LLTTINQSFKQ